MAEEGNIITDLNLGNGEDTAPSAGRGTSGAMCVPQREPGHA